MGNSPASRSLFSLNRREQSDFPLVLAIARLLLLLILLLFPLISYVILHAVFAIARVIAMNSCEW